MFFGAELVPGARLAAIYDPIIVGRPAFISFQTAALRLGIPLVSNDGIFKDVPRTHS